MLREIPDSFAFLSLEVDIMTFEGGLTGKGMGVRRLLLLLLQYPDSFLQYYREEKMGKQKDEEWRKEGQQDKGQM